MVKPRTTRRHSALVLVGVASLMLSSCSTPSRESSPLDHSPVMTGKVARFAFHALLQAGPYELDYRNISHTTSTWTALFTDGPDVQDLRRSIYELKRSHRSVLQDLRQFLRGSKRDLHAKAQRDLRNFVDQSRLSLRVIQEDLRRRERLLEKTIASGGPTSRRSKSDWKGTSSL